MMVCKWGRVGATPQFSRKDYASVAQAKHEFKNTFKKKTKNAWGSGEFRPQKGKYIMVDVVEGDDDDLGWEDVQIDPATSELEQTVFQLIQRITSRRLAAEALRSLNIDVDRFPLGKLSPEQVASGYKILQLLSVAIQNKTSQVDLANITNRFYTLIPHDFGMSRPPIIATMKHLRGKIQLLELLDELQAASHILTMRSGKNTNLIDLHYHALQCAIKPIQDNHDTFKLLSKFVTNTHAPTHTKYTLEVMNMFQVARNGDSQRHEPFTRLHNRRLLWHGSRMSNFVGILSQGLRIAPPEAPKTGYMFGKGLYFADLCSKSANYSYATPENPYGLLILADVALGEMYPLQEAEYIEQAPKYYHSVWGQGKLEPDKNVTETLDGSLVTYGKPVRTEVQDTALQYNEFIVYDVGQVEMKYLILVKFT
eukprot:UN24490